MSQMGRVIRAVNQLFRQRDEQLLAYQKDTTLFYAARDFKTAIECFEKRHREKLK